MLDEKCADVVVGRMEESGMWLTWTSNELTIFRRVRFVSMHFKIFIMISEAIFAALSAYLAEIYADIVVVVFVVMACHECFECEFIWWYLTVMWCEIMTLYVLIMKFKWRILRKVVGWFVLIFFSCVWCGRLTFEHVTTLSWLCLWEQCAFSS